MPVRPGLQRLRQRGLRPAVDLLGNGGVNEEAAPTGPTTIQGNYIGLDASEASLIANTPV